MSSVSEVKKKEFTLDEVSKHASAEDCWLIIGNESNGA
jgi:cytochrome b involved in lipid metabolism